MSNEVICAECGAPMVLRRSAKYPHPFYGCSNYPACTGTHGAHPDGRPLGIPATKETKAWRIKAHDAFDRLWKEGHMSRGRAYRRLARLMGADEIHIGEADISTCRQVIDVSNELYEISMEDVATGLIHEDAGDRI